MLPGGREREGTVRHPRRDCRTEEIIRKDPAGIYKQHEQGEKENGLPRHAKDCFSGGLSNYGADAFWWRKKGKGASERWT